MKARALKFAQSYGLWWFLLKASPYPLDAVVSNTARNKHKAVSNYELKWVSSRKGEGFIRKKQLINLLKIKFSKRV